MFNVVAAWGWRVGPCSPILDPIANVSPLWPRPCFDALLQGPIHSPISSGLLLFSPAIFFFRVSVQSVKAWLLCIFFLFRGILLRANSRRNGATECPSAPFRSCALLGPKPGCNHARACCFGSSLCWVIPGPILPGNASLKAFEVARKNQVQVGSRNRSADGNDKRAKMTFNNQLPGQHHLF